MRNNLVFLAVVIAVLFLAWAGADVAPRLAEVMSWMAVHSPFPSNWTPYVVPLVLFTGLRLATLPYQLTHSRIDRATGRVTRYYDLGDDTSEWASWVSDLLGRFSRYNMLVSPPVLRNMLFVTTLDGVLLLLMALVTEQPLPGWPPTSPDDWGTPAICIAAVLFVALDVALVRLTLPAVWNLFDTRTSKASDPDLLYEMEWDDLFPHVFIIDILVYLPLFSIMGVAYSSRALLFGILPALFTVKVVMAHTCYFISLHLGWRQRLWLERTVPALVRQLIEKDRKRRVAAAQTLSRLHPDCRWTLRRSLEALMNDSDPAIRALVNQILQTLAHPDPKVVGQTIRKLAEQTPNKNP